MAHSLGNMVVSSMIQDHGLTVSKYLMCDSAVPSEAYYPPQETAIRVPQLVHPDWEDYPTNSWASNWHKLFSNDEGDDRGRLGWPGRFADVARYAVNFYSTGDEVLELVDDNDLSVLDGITSGYVQYSWHHQELWKGRSVIDGLGGTTWAGWNIEENAFGVNKISVARARAMDQIDPSPFRTNTVFYLNPPSMNSTNIPPLVRGAILTMGIPALTRPTGATNLTWRIARGDNYNLNLNRTEVRSEDASANVLEYGIPRPNGWPTRGRWGSMWLHSDMKDVSYFFNYKFYEKVKEKGGLQ